MKEEELMVKRALDAETTWPKLRAVLEHELLEKYVTRLVDMSGSGFVWMLQNDKVDDLARMYSLLCRVKEGDGLMISRLTDDVVAQGTALMDNQQLVQDPKALINAVLELRARYMQIVNHAFAREVASEPARSSGSRAPPSRTVSRIGPQGQTLYVEKRYIEAVDAACEKFFNAFPNAAEFLSLYLDRLLRQDFKGSSETEIDQKLESVMYLFHYLQEKDIFERYYKQHLSKRLLQTRIVSDDAEKWILSKLKSDRGYLYTSKLERMFNDIRTSADLKIDFLGSLTHPDEVLGGIDFSVHVLTTVAWPISEAPFCEMPLEVDRCIKSFGKYYLAKHKGRMLKWQAHVGTSATLKGHFDERSHELEVSTYHMCVLMLYNDNDSLTYSQILRATRIPESELKRTLQVLSLGKYRILLKEGKAKEIEPDERFTFNSNFSSRLVRIRIQTISAHKETEVERQQTRSRLDQDRSLVIDAAIVRVMKTRKRLDLANLTAETIQLLADRFTPLPHDIKKRIETLIERDYLSREESDHRTFVYQA
eukprot:Plantae.Rhodophyta-Rhodochaete_pulchella.ctg5203.p1 GENE.Plantae.Rhodophyta-Rhodochaete_pulchella.ctg5203~~Plantae.Rhodophyta-Rhodochaete_pulchella.ctg5203.p1  ORF type:complete len:537 (+),score=112.20 Plantae.Rhodophyta-Rhodochaete_pulchella.ctg5203:3-1613(+)